MNDPATFAEWLATRPASVQELAAEFPLATVFAGPKNQPLFLVGYNEDGYLIVSETDPHEDYEGAVATKQ